MELTLFGDKVNNINSTVYNFIYWQSQQKPLTKAQSYIDIGHSRLSVNSLFTQQVYHTALNR